MSGGAPRGRLATVDCEPSGAIFRISPVSARLMYLLLWLSIAIFSGVSSALASKSATVSTVRFGSGWADAVVAGDMANPTRVATRPPSATLPDLLPGSAQPAATAPATTRSRPARRIAGTASAGPISAAATASNPGASSRPPPPAGRLEAGTGSRGAPSRGRPAVPYRVTPSCGLRCPEATSAAGYWTRQRCRPLLVRSGSPILISVSDPLGYTSYAAGAVPEETATGAQLDKQESISGSEYTSALSGEPQALRFS